MKCGVLTFHRAINYGGVLQAYALQQAGEKLDSDIEIIDYYCPAIEKLYRPKGMDYLLKSNLKRMAAALLRNGVLFFNNRGFSNFRKKYLRTSEKKFFSYEDLCQAQYDKYIAGSDQVWSYYCAGFDVAYFLDFVHDSRKKNSYAASFGVGSIPEELHGKYHELLHDYNYISVREVDGAKIVKSVINRDVEVVPDPTLLLDKNDWSKLLPSERTIGRQYILLYMMAEDQDLIDEALRIGRETGLNVYYISDCLYKKHDVIYLRKVSPEQWVDLFMNAEYIFTNSFHGVAFSINFKKNFYVKALIQNQKVNSRIFNIMQYYRLKMDSLNVLATNNEVDSLLVAERNKGYSALRKILDT